MHTQQQCKHQFHAECLGPHLAVHADCPICRAPAADRAKLEAAAAAARSAASRRSGVYAWRRPLPQRRTAAVTTAAAAAAAATAVDADASAAAVSEQEAQTSAPERRSRSGSSAADTAVPAAAH
jgi:hypothetical protein